MTERNLSFAKADLQGKKHIGEPNEKCDKCFKKARVNKIVVNSAAEDMQCDLECMLDSLGFVNLNAEIGTDGSVHLKKDPIFSSFGTTQEEDSFFNMFMHKQFIADDGEPVFYNMLDSLGFKNLKTFIGVDGTLIKQEPGVEQVTLTPTEKTFYKMFFLSEKN